MADLPECSPEDTKVEQTREDILANRALDLAARFYPNRDSEHCRSLARAVFSALRDTDNEATAPRPIPLTDKETRQRITEIVWNQTLYPWYDDHKEDRHVPSLFLRSDPVLHRLANLITEQLCAVREQTFAEQVLTPEQRERLERWCDEQKAKVLTDQQQENPDQKRPYFGAIGGSLTWTRTPTSLGTVTKVIFCQGTKWEAELDLTDYSDW